MDRYVFQFNPAQAEDEEPTLTISCPGYPFRNSGGTLEYFPPESITLFSLEAMEALRDLITKALLASKKIDWEAENEEAKEKEEMLQADIEGVDKEILDIELKGKPNERSNDTAPNTGNNPPKPTPTFRLVLGGELRSKAEPPATVVEGL